MPMPLRTVGRDALAVQIVYLSAGPAQGWRAPVVRDDEKRNEPTDREGGLQHAARRGWTLKQLEKHYVRAILHKTQGRTREAARILGIPHRVLLRKIRGLIH